MWRRALENEIAEDNMKGRWGDCRQHEDGANCKAIGCKVVRPLFAQQKGTPFSPSEKAGSTTTEPKMRLLRLEPPMTVLDMKKKNSAANSGKRGQEPAERQLQEQLARFWRGSAKRRFLMPAPIRNRQLPS